MVGCLRAATEADDEVGGVVAAEEVYGGAFAFVAVHQPLHCVDLGTAMLLHARAFCFLRSFF